MASVSGSLSLGKLEYLEGSLKNIVNEIELSLNAKLGNSGDLTNSDSIMMSSTTSGSGTSNLSIASGLDHNAIFKKESTDEDFVYVGTLSKGQISNLTYTTGTIIRSSRGVYGISGPFPTPLCPKGLAFKTSRLSTLVASTTVIVAATDIRCHVTLFESDGVTVADGPITLEDNGVGTLACNGTGEFVVSSTANIVGVVNGNGSELRILAPMATRLICWNNGNKVSSMIGTASVEWHRRNGTTGTVSVPSGTPTDLGAGTSNAFSETGCVILRSDVPISCHTTSDGDANQSIPGVPFDMLAHNFPNPGYLDNTDSFVAIGSPFVGSAKVYNSSGTIVATFQLTRNGGTATSYADQQYPATGKWSPADDGLTSLEGGFIKTTVPSMCIMNFKGSSVWTGEDGKECLILGNTPLQCKALFVENDSDMLYHRTWVGSSVNWAVA